MENRLGRRLKDEVERSYSQGVVRKLGIKNLEFEEEVLYRPDIIERVRLRDMKGAFENEKAVKEGRSSKLIYKAYLKQNKGLCYKLIVLNPGKIGKEFYKTKGHFHRNPADTEIYLGFKGQGVVILQHKRTDGCIFVPLEPGNIVHVPPYYAHRAVNIGEEELIFLSIYPRTSGSDYKSIKEKGDFKYLIKERNGKAEMEKNLEFKA